MNIAFIFKIYVYLISVAYDNAPHSVTELTSSSYKFIVVVLLECYVFNYFVH